MKRFLIRLALLALLFVVVSCSRNTALIDALKDQVTELEAGQEKLAGQIAAEQKLRETAAAARDRLAAEHKKTLIKIRDIANEFDADRDDFSQYKRDYRRSMQAKAKGMTLPDILIDGQQYQKVIVSSATDTELTVLHSKGIAHLPLATVPASLQALFGYDPSATSHSSLGGNETPGVDDPVANKARGKAAVDEAHRLLDEKKRAAMKKKPPVYLAAPSSQSTSGFSWRNTSGFEGSYWAPLKGGKKGTTSKQLQSTSRLGSPIP